MHRFFVTTTPLREGTTIALNELAHQLHTVLRLRAGSSVILLDGSGLQFEARIRRLDAHLAILDVGVGATCSTEPRIRITLYACSLKGEKFEWVLQKATELGASRFVPVVSARSIVRPTAAIERKYDRWRSVIREAAEQSGRALLPELGPAQEFAAAVTGARGTRLLPWEEAPLAERVSSLRGEVSLLVGPEGGLTPGEAELARTQGWQITSLGPRTLRAESAAIAAVTAVLVLADDLGSFGAGGSGAI